MDAFISRKKRKLSPHSHLATQSSTPDHEYEKAGTHQEASSSIATPEDEETESTDFKLALLSSLHPDTDQQLLLDVLLAHEGSVEDASAALSADSSSTPHRQNGSSDPTSISISALGSATAAATGYQSSLSNFLSRSNSNSNSELNTDPEKPLKAKPKLPTKHGKTLHLYSPSDVEVHTPCSIIHNFLPADEANALLKELLGEAESFERSSFRLFDNVVQSPHTACFYMESLEEIETQKTEYIYNGGKLDDIRQLTPMMKLIAPKVTAAVNNSIAARQNTHSTTSSTLEPNKTSSPPLELWKPNAAFVNCYNGPAESVGYHSDQLTYLGPRAVIGSISLGVAREFRVRRIVPSDEKDSDNTKTSSNSTLSSTDPTPRHSDIQGQISIHLPHNSLLIMHASMQEFWKHSIAPSQSIIPHPISGNKRINITYRDYKEYLHPKYTPRCKCGVPAVLRVVQRKRENLGRYFWMCYARNAPVPAPEKGKEGGCKWFEWAVFDERGRPVWKNGGGKDGKFGKSVAVANDKSKDSGEAHGSCESADGT
ncbi:hypothetical protein ONS95_001224 [Cadophora gregata]|uniref:uncharacterized protein n=1 Tax=Cadophora gregata TaxID=51156 RepID=UPI0026DC2724|nr:uncharacterized protein ONS95_001224 [Cadophora gregata]KAK0101967.1 hypothetical protein ONS96_005937 [Cadophora gregata f. sp. sojae]KAK0129291.1 hypothetical protein ONS95_001224 [Cadophora gregata]